LNRKATICDIFLPNVRSGHLRTSAGDPTTVRFTLKNGHPPGVRAYVAPSSEPEGSDVALFLHHLFHQLLRRGAPLDAAWAHARGYDEQGAMFVLHRADAPLSS